MKKFPVVQALISTLAALSGSAPSVLAGYVNATASAGINYVQQVYPNYTSVTQLPPQQYFMSGGAAAGDYDNDGWVDLYVTRFDNSDILYRNKGDGTFVDVTMAAFGANHLANVKTNGVSWADIDNDGDLDLYILTVEYPRHLLYINDGAGHFEERGVARGAHVPELGQGARYGFSAAFGDYDRDGYLDLHVTEWRQEGEAVPGEYGRHHPNVRHNTRLLRNRGAAQPGYFEDVTISAGVATEGVASTVPTAMSSEGFAPRFADLDHDGWPDLLIAQDHKTSRLFWNNKNGTFTDGTVTAGVGSDRYGMGSAVGDYDNDGDLDWFVTSIFVAGEYTIDDPLRRDGNRLYRYDGNRKFTDDTIAAGVLEGGWGWGAAFLDYDNDGDLDLFMTNGMDVILDSQKFDDLFERDPSVLWNNNGAGKFTKVSASMGITDNLSGKGVLTFDYDRDGDLDLFIVNNGAQPILYRNDGGNASKWLRLKLEGRRGSNRQAIGAFVKITPDLSQPTKFQVREVDAGSHYLGQSETTLHFGVGQATRIDQVRIEWPDGEVCILKNLETGAEYFVPQEAVFTNDTNSFVTSQLAEFSAVMRTSCPVTGFSAVDLPEGLNIDATTGEISGAAKEFGFFHPTITATFTGGSVDQVIEIRVRSTYEGWHLQHFGEVQADVPGLYGRGDDFDQDGRTNFQEYAENTDPKVWDIGSRYVFLEVEGETYLGLQYTVPNYADDVVAFPQQAQEFGDWSAAIVVPSEVQNITTNLFDVVTVRRSKPVAELPGGFLRVIYSNAVQE